MVSSKGVFGILIAAATGTLFLVPAHSAAQWELFHGNPCSSSFIYASRVQSLIGCAETGYAPDQYRVGVIYANGMRVTENDEEAVRWFRMAAEQGYPPAQNSLGLIYAEGDGVPEDDREAVRWYRLAAEQGHASAQSNLGVMYDNGNGVPEDDVEAVRWYRLAAEQGDALAQSNLGFMYASGDGVPEDLVFAYMWFNLSAAQGNESAQRNEERIEQYMIREQIAEAQRLSREWIGTHPPDGGN